MFFLQSIQRYDEYPINYGLLAIKNIKRMKFFFSLLNLLSEGESDSWTFVWCKELIGSLYPISFSQTTINKE